MIMLPCLCVGMLVPPALPTAARVAAARVAAAPSVHVSPSAHATVFPACRSPSLSPSILLSRFSPEEVEARVLTPEEEAEAKTRGRIVFGVIVANSIFWQYLRPTLRGEENALSKLNPLTSRKPRGGGGRLRMQLDDREAPAGLHPGVVCDKSLSPIWGWRYTRRGSQPSFDLCEAEYRRLSPEQRKGFERIAPPVTPRRALLGLAAAGAAIRAGSTKLHSSDSQLFYDDFIELPPLSPAEKLVAFFFHPS